MNLYRISCSLGFIALILFAACEDPNDHKMEVERLNRQIAVLQNQRAKLQNYIDAVLNVRYDANSFASRRKKSWKIKDPISSADLLAIMNGERPVYLPESLEITELASVSPAPPKNEVTDQSLDVSTTSNLDNLVIEDNTLKERPLAETEDTINNSGAVGDLSDLQTIPAPVRRVGVSRGLAPASGSNTAPASGTSAEGVAIIQEQARITLSLDEDLLFDSGSTKINRSGNRVISAIARKLAEHKDYLVMVEGHTDNVEVSNLGAIKDNWDLSVMRATQVTRTLVRNGLSPQNLIAAGRGEYQPRSNNGSKAGRKANRRIEIVLTPWPKIDG